MPSTPVSFPDLAAFKVVPPNADVKVSDLKLNDGTPLVGRDGFLVPQARSFATIVNSATRVYSYRFDEAMRDNWTNARAMRRDAFLRGLIEERILPTINREYTLEVDDERDPEQQFVRDGLLRIVRATRNFDAMKRALLDAVWFGRSGVQWTWGKNPEVDDLWGVAKWDPLHGDSVQFTFDDTPAILMDSLTTSWYANNGATRGPHGDIRSTDRGGSALVLQRPHWRERFAIHQHILEKADFFEGELAGSVQGLGLRGLVYWQYVVRTDALTWMLAYMQAVGQMDLLVFNYPAGNYAAQQKQELNAQQVIGKAAIACPRPANGNWPAIEQIPMNSAGLGALQTLVADYFDRHIERLIVGQSMSSGQDKGTGLGGTGRAEFAKATKDEILIYDTGRLDQTLTHDLIAPLKRYNFPWARFPVRFKSVMPDLKAGEKVQAGMALVQVGINIKAQELREAAGYSNPEPGDETVGAPQGPTGAGGPPGGGGGSPPPSWQGGAPMLLARGAAPIRYAGMGFPGGANTFLPGAQREREIRTPYAGNFPREPWLSPLTDLIDHLPDVNMQGIRVQANRNTHEVQIAVESWVDRVTLYRLQTAAKDAVGPRSVTITQGTYVPSGLGWVTLYQRQAPTRYARHDCCSTQINLMGEAAFRVLQAGYAVHPDDLAADGREDSPHVTVKYGLEPCDPGTVADRVNTFGSVSFHLTGFDYFSTADADVLYVAVESPDLAKLHGTLSALPNHDEHPTYTPHATVAYLKKGLGAKYKATFAPLDLHVVADGLVFSDCDRVHTWIGTAGQAAGAQLIGSKVTGATTGLGGVQYGKKPAAAYPPMTAGIVRSQGREAQARHVAKRNAAPAADNAARLVDALKLAGTLTRRQVQKKLGLNAQALDAAAAHAKEQGTLDVRERRAHANGGGRLTQEFHLQQQEPEQYNLADQRAFEEQLNQNPFDSITHGVYADWLREQGRDQHARIHDRMREWSADANPNARPWAPMAARDYVEENFDYGRNGNPTSYAWLNAPPGGATLNGRPYRAGQFLPGTTMFQHTPGSRPATPYAPVAGQEPLPPGAAPPGAVDQAFPQGGAPGAPPPPDAGLGAAAGPEMNPLLAGPQPVRTPGLTPEDEIVEVQSQVFAFQNYPLLRTAYFTGDPGMGVPGRATLDPISGDVRSLTLDEDSWRPLLPGYTGTNPGAVNAAAAWLNGQLFGESLRNQYGKGNRKMIVVSGTGSLPPDSALQDYLKTSGYPIVVDGGTSYPLLAAKLEGAKAAGFAPEMTYVDEPPGPAVAASVDRALEGRQKGQPARTTPLAQAIQENIAARRSALELIFRNPDVATRVVDRRNTPRFQRRMIVDPRHAAQYLSQGIHQDEAAAGMEVARLRQQVLQRYQAGELPVDVVTGLLGPGWEIRPPVSF